MDKCALPAISAFALPFPCRRLNAKDHGKDPNVIPDKDGWAVKEERSPVKVLPATQKEAVADAKEKRRRTALS